MGFMSLLKGVWRRLFPLKDIKQALNIKVAVSDTMLNKISDWQDCLSGNAQWVKKDDNVFSLRIEKDICREFSNIVFNEMTAKVTNARLNEIFERSTRNITEKFQKGLGTGALIIKPLGVGHKVQYVGANAFIPIEYDSDGMLVKVIFPDFKKIGDKYYTRLEYHDLDIKKGLTITNRAYVSSSERELGREIPLSAVDEWSALQSYINFPMMKQPAYGYYRNPIDNDIDGSHCGVSIFDSAMPKIKCADVQFGRLDWEFESGERAVHIDSAALKDGKHIEHLNKRLYRGVDIDGGNEELFKEYSPQLRQSDIIAGLEEYKREIEFSVGLAYGDLSNPTFVSKTATEVLSSKERKYNTVNSIQKNLKDCLSDLVYALAFYNSLTTSGYEFICDFKDSILTDETEERKQDQQDLANGTLRPEEYRAKWRGEDIETARKNLPLSAQVIE